MMTERTRFQKGACQSLNELNLVSVNCLFRSITMNEIKNIIKFLTGAETYMRPDVVLQILIQDAQRMTENFAMSYMAVTSEDTSNVIHQQKLKELQENWRRKNNRGDGHYTKKPEPLVLNNLKYALITSTKRINDDLVIPHLSITPWLNVAIGLLISMKTIRDSSLSPPIQSTTLLNEIVSFVNKWMNCLRNIKPPKKTSAEQTQLINTKFDIPPDVPTDANDQINYILHKILLPLIDHSIPAIKAYICESCKLAIHTKFHMSYITLNITEGQLQLNNQLNYFFNGSISDKLCEKCSNSMLRSINLLDCK